MSRTACVVPPGVAGVPRSRRGPVAAAPDGGLPPGIRVALRLALLAIVLAAVMPTVLRLLAGPSSWVEVCTSGGTRWVRLGDAPGRRESDRSLQAGAACDYCTLAHDVPVLPITWATAPLRPCPAAALPRVRPASALAWPGVWRRPPGRAPPGARPFPANPLG